MPRSVDTSLFVLPSGKSLSMGLDIVAGTNSSPPVERRIRWIRESDGSVVAQISSYNLDSGPPPYINNLRLGAEDSGGSGDAFVQLTSQSGGAGAGSRVQAGAAAETRTIVDSAGRSSFLQNGVLGGLDNLKIQQGTIVGVAFPAGTGGIAVNLPVAWSTNHYLFLASLSQPSLHFNYTVPQSGGVNTLAQGGVVATNLGAAQTITVRWLSLGS